MKATLGILVVIAMGWLAVYLFGGYASFNPSEEGRKAKAALRPGMSFNEACKLTGGPRKFRIINRKVQRINGAEVVDLVPAPPVKCTQDRINQRLAEGSLPYGFICTFTFSVDVAFGVQYDDTGTVVEVFDLTTVANWLHE